MTQTADKPYILSIGDTFTDAFIELNEETAKVDTDAAGKKWLSVEFGAKFPYKTVDIVEAVGPSPNAAVAFSRLGVQSGLMTYVGDDETGDATLKHLQNENIKTDTVSVQPGAKSNYWYVLRYGADRTMLTKNEGYDYQWQEPDQVPDWIYLAQSGDGAWELHEQVVDYLKQHPETKLVFQPGTVHFAWGRDKLADVYRHAEVLILNREEAAEVADLPIDSLADLSNALHALGPKVVVITDGPDGAYASEVGEDGKSKRLLQVPNYPDPSAPVDRTGAGDAFASTLVTALALGESLDTALLWAPINSMSVVQSIGAQVGLLTRDQLEEHLANAPAEFVVKTL